MDSAGASALPPADPGPPGQPSPSGQTDAAARRHRIARDTTAVAAAAAFLLISVKLAVGLMTGTVSVLASAVDSLLDFMVSSFNAFAVRSSVKPSDERYNYGRGKMEGVAAFVEGLFILGSALYIARKAVAEFHREQPLAGDALGWSLAAMAFSLAVTFALVVFLGRQAKASGSLVLEADTVHYKMDLVTNGSVLLALGLVAFTGWDWLDPAIALVISLVVAKAALPVLRKGLDVLLDRALEPVLVDRIRDLAETHSVRVNGVHELRTRRAGDTRFVELHLVFDEEIRLLEAHRIADEIEARIRALEPGRWEINIHLDPVDDSFRDRRLSRREPGE